VSDSPQAVVAFSGGVSCRRDDRGPLGVTLVGRTLDHPDELAVVSFSGTAPDGLPEALEDARVERLSPNTWRIASLQREWLVTARAIHVHREISATFYRAVAPRVAPLGKRVFWRIILALVQNPTAKRVLFALRR
jgi:hypothetical protein